MVYKVKSWYKRTIEPSLKFEIFFPFNTFYDLLFVFIDVKSIYATLLPLILLVIPNFFLYIKYLWYFSTKAFDIMVRKNDNF